MSANTDVESKINVPTKQPVEVMFACGHEGVVDAVVSISMTGQFTNTPVSEEIVQYVIFQDKIKCDVCNQSLWEKK